jgi:ComF family protein
METKLLGAWSILGREALRIVLPSWCAACERELPWRDRMASCCGPCWSSLPRIDATKCRSCALPWEGPAIENYVCLDCQLHPLPVEWCDAWGHYRGALEKLVQAFKFERHDFLDDAFAGLLEETLLARGDAAFDAIVPVPMHRAKERRRGYNQAELIARALAKRIGSRCHPSLLTKTAERATQSTLDRSHRAANVHGVFAASKSAKGRSILLVDDVCTTGETLRACAAQLVRAGAGRVCAIAVAKA